MTATGQVPMEVAPRGAVSSVMGGHDGCIILPAVEVVRHGRAVATIGPASGGTGKALKEALRANRPDAAWADELRELREGMEPVRDPWRG
jgi:hypothetical protein